MGEAGSDDRRTPEPESGWAEAFIGKTVAEVMVTQPKSLPVDATAGEVLGVFDDEHVHMVLLVERGILRGTLERRDLPTDLWSDAARGRRRMHRPALALATLSGRTVPPTMPVLEAWELLMARRSRRSAVVDERGALLGLLCLKRRLTGFCSDADVAARAAERDGHGAPGRASR
jgi:CBS domain-containing protein